MAAGVPDEHADRATTAIAANRAAVITLPCSFRIDSVFTRARSKRGHATPVRVTAKPHRSLRGSRCRSRQGVGLPSQGVVGTVDGKRAGCRRDTRHHGRPMEDPAASQALDVGPSQPGVEVRRRTTDLAAIVRSFRVQSAFGCSTLPQRSDRGRGDQRSSPSDCLVRLAPIRVDVTIWKRRGAPPHVVRTTSAPINAAVNCPGRPTRH